MGRKIINKRLFFGLIHLLFFGFLTNCQTNGTTQRYSETLVLEHNSLSEYHGRIDLSQDTLEEQQKDKLEAAEKLADALKQRVIVETIPPPPSATDSNINVASYARTTKNDLGQKIYQRSPFHGKNHVRECAKFRTKDLAQKSFLENGGPERDLNNLDPDGDGFACLWDPHFYRKLTATTD